MFIKFLIAILTQIYNLCNMSIQISKLQINLITY